MSLCADSRISVNCRLEIAAPMWMRALACHWLQLAASFGHWPINPQASAVSSLCARTSVARHSASVRLTATQRAAHCQRLPQWKWLWHCGTGLLAQAASGSVPVSPAVAPTVAATRASGMVLIPGGRSCRAYYLAPPKAPTEDEGPYFPEDSRFSNPDTGTCRTCPGHRSLKQGAQRLSQFARAFGCACRSPPCCSPSPALELH